MTRFSSSTDDLSDLLFSQSLGNHKFLVTGALYVCGQGKAGQLGIDPFPKPNAKFTAVPTQLAIFEQHGLQVRKCRKPRRSVADDELRIIRW